MSVDLPDAIFMNSSPSSDDVGGLFFDFDLFRTTSGSSWPSGRGDGVSATSRHRDAAFETA